jgi:hypothetical protein
MDQKDLSNENCSQSHLGSTNCEANINKQLENFDPTFYSQSKFESPTPEKPDWGRKGIVITSLAKNLLTENSKDQKENSVKLSDK